MDLRPREAQEARETQAPPSGAFSPGAAHRQASAKPRRLTDSDTKIKGVIGALRRAEAPILNI